MLGYIKLKLPYTRKIPTAQSYPTPQCNALLSMWHLLQPLGEFWPREVSLGEGNISIPPRDKPMLAQSLCGLMKVDQAQNRNQGLAGEGGGRG